MITKVKVPKLSANVEEVTVTGWFKSEGDEVRKGEPLVEMTTDKACFEVEAPRSGFLRQALAGEKSTLPVGYVVALIGNADDPLPDVAESNRRLLDKHRRSLDGARESGRKTATRKRRAVRATPAARRLAREFKIDLGRVKERLNVDVVTENSVKAYLEEEKG